MGSCSLCCSHSTKDGSPSSPGLSSQASAVIVDILGVWGFFRAPHSDFSIEASSSFDKALTFMSPIRMVSMAHGVVYVGIVVPTEVAPQDYVPMVEV